VFESDHIVGYSTTFDYDSNNCMYQKVEASGTPNSRTFSYACDSASGLTPSELDNNARRLVLSPQ